MKWRVAIVLIIFILTTISVENRATVIRLEIRQDSIKQVLDSLKYDIFKHELAIELYEAKFK